MPRTRARRQQTANGPDGSGAMAARRRLGRLMTELREAADVTVEEAAEFIERAPSTMWRLEAGQSGVRIRPQGDVGRLCDLYEVDGETREGLLALVEATKVKGWFQPYSDVLRPKFDMYLGLEDVCDTLCTYEPERIPGLLQTEGYARAIMSLPGPKKTADQETVERRVKVRTRRQEVLTRKDPRAPQIDVVLSETVLRRPIGGPEVMAEQLRHLNRLAELRNLSLRVLPFSAGLQHGLITGQFVILRFSNAEEEPPRVFVDGVFGDLWFDEPEQIDWYEAAFADIRKASLGQAASRDTIERAAKELADSA
ncbi:MAG: helix-turn-helix domain-containing protein [Micromonosporaceae bacterium]